MPGPRYTPIVLIVRHALAVLSNPGAVGEPGHDGESPGDVVCDGGVVVIDPPPRSPTDEVLDATGCIVTPGLVNAHHHLLQTAFRTLPGTRGVAMSQWLPTMAAAYRQVGVDEELVHAAAAAGLAESLLSGVTTVADHHLTWPSGGHDAAFARATDAAARMVGARLVFVRGSAGDDPEAAAAGAEAVASALVPNSRAGAEPSGVSHDGLTQVAVGPAGVHSDGPETFRLLAEVARRHGLRRRTQANEQVDVEVAATRYGRRPIDLLAEWGWLARDVTLAHLCDVTEAEVAQIARSGATATHAPGCDVPMGWGVAPVAGLLDAGVGVGLGTSGGGSNDAGHLFADARLAMQVSTMAPWGRRPLAAREVLALATAGSAAGLGRPELGSLRQGSAADLCVWDVSGVLDAGVGDPVAGLLWASPGRRPRYVVVAGRVVVRDGELTTDGARTAGARLRAVLAQRGRTIVTSRQS